MIGFVRPLDTRPGAHRAQVEAYRRMSPGERLALALGMGDELRAVVADGVRARHPDYGEESVAEAVIALALGAALYREAFRGRSPVPP